MKLSVKFFLGALIVTFCSAGYAKEIRTHKDTSKGILHSITQTNTKTGLTEVSIYNAKGTNVREIKNYSGGTLTSS
jgi:hypothetical protein